jgi:hypothetical protein
MAKFKVFAVQKIHYEMEIEAQTANEAEEKYWDMDELGNEIDGSSSVYVDEIHCNGDIVTNYERNYVTEVQNAN